MSRRPGLWILRIWKRSFGPVRWRRCSMRTLPIWAFLRPGDRRSRIWPTRYGALCIAQPEVAALGIMESPMNQGADIVCGDIQPLGMHIQFGGGQAGFIACQQDVGTDPAVPHLYVRHRRDRGGRKIRLGPGL